MEPDDGSFSHIDLGSLLDTEDPGCGCPGPPPPPMFPETFLPPPPAPSTEFCENSVSGLQVCEVGYLESKFEDPGVPFFAIIIVCALLLIVMVTVIIFLVWRHKRKAQNMAPFKGVHHQTKNPHCDLSSPHNVANYDEALINHHAVRLPNHVHRPDTQTLAPIELLDIKLSSSQYNRPPLPDPNNRSMYMSYPGCSSNQNTSSCSSTDTVASRDSRQRFNPVYEEVTGCYSDKRGASVDSDIDETDAEPDSVVSEDEFAEDELSLADFPKDDDDIPESNEKSFRPIDHPGTPSDTLGSKKRNKHSSRSIDRNMDHYPSDTLRAKHNYYVSKNKMAADIYGPGSNRKGQYSSKNPNHNHTRSSRGNYNRNSSGSGGSAVNSHSTGTPPYHDPRTSYYTGGRSNRGNGDPMNHRQSSFPNNHSRTMPSDAAGNNMPGYNQFNKMQNHPGHRPENYNRHQSSIPYNYNRRQRTPTDHPSQKKPTIPADYNNHFSPSFSDPGAPFIIDGNKPKSVNSASHPSENSFGPPVTPGVPNVNYTSGQNSIGGGQSNEVHEEDEPIYNELDPVYAQRPLYT